MEVVKAEQVRRSLNTLSSDDRNRVDTWLSYFERDYSFVKEHSVQIQLNNQPVFMFVTSTDVRIFYSIDTAAKRITILNIAKKETILSSGSFQGA